MISMFEAASRFNNGDQTTSPSVSGTAPLNWQTSSLSSATRMFAGASVFNQNVNSMNLSQVADLSSVFNGAAFFNNGDAGGTDNRTNDVRMTWTVSNATIMTSMFEGATRFNQDLSSWNTGSATNMRNMFKSNLYFNNGDAEGTTSNVVMAWNTANVTDMTEMFRGASRFNQDLNSWNTAKVTTLNATFQDAVAFNNGDSTTSNTANASVSMSWSVSSLTNLSAAFMGATSFNQDLNGWNTSKITTLFSSFQNATSFNNGDALTANSTNTNVEMTWNLSAATTLNSAFFGATSFNQDLNSWVLPKAGQMGTVLRNASRFNNGDPAGAHETDGVNQVAMTWSLSGTTDLSWAFSGATVFNQNISSWNVSSVSNLSYFAGSDSLTDSHFNNGASSTSQNVWNWTTSSLTNLSFAFAGLQRFNADISSWDTSKVTSLRQTFVKASRFNQDISRWTTSAVTDMSNTFALATAFNQPIGRWNVSNVTEMSGMFSTARSFNQDLSNWGPFQAGNNMLGMFMDAQNMNDSPKNWDMSWAPVGSSKLQYLFGNLSAFTTSDMALSVSKSILRGWSFQKVNRQTSVGFFKGPLYSNCEEWSSYERLRLRSWTFQGVGGFTPTAPTCTSVTVTWSPTSTYSASFGSITPDVMATTNGPSGVKYAVHSAGTSRCRVNPDTGVISHLISGSCEIMAYDAGQNSNTAVQPGYRIAVFSLPTPQFPATPTAPIINSTRADSGAIAINFGAPSTSGTAPLGGYEVGYSLTQGGSKTWVTVSPVVTSSPTLSYALSGLVNGTNYWLVVRGFNSNGVGSSSPEVGPVQPAPPISTASQPIIFSVNKPGDSSNATIEFLAPASDGGDPISGYDIRFSTNEGVSWGAWQSASATLNLGTQRWTVSLSGLQGSALLPSYYIFEVRARNSVGVSAASTQIPSGAPINSVSFGNQSATVSFRAARYDGNSPILGYEYMLREGPSSSPTSVSSWISISSTIWQQATATTTASFALNGLTNGNTYTVWVRAVNALGGLTTEYQNWLNNTGIPDKAIASLSFSYGVSAISYSPNASYSPLVTTVSDGALTYTTSTPLVCSVNSSTGLISGFNVGTCVIGLNQAEGTNHQASSASTQVRIDRANQPSLVIAASSTSATFGSTVTLSTSGGAGGGGISYNVVSPSTCQISGNVVTLGNAGSLCSVTATKAGDTNYFSADSSPLTITINKILPTLSLNYGVGAASYSPSASFSPNVASVSDGALTFTSSTPLVCVVNSSTGRITGVNAGNCSITLNQAEGTNYLAFSASAQIRIDPANQSTLTVNVSATSSPFGSTVTLSSAGGNGSGSVSFSTVSPSTCQLSGNVVTLGNAGSTCLVIATKAADGNYLAASSTQLSIATSKAVPTLSLSYGVTTQTYSANASYSPNVTTNSDGSLSYSSLTPSLCSVNAGSGLVSNLNAGSCVIRVTVAEGSNHLTASVSATIITTKANQPTLVVTPSSTSAIYLNNIYFSYSGGAGTGLVSTSVSSSSGCAVSGNVVTMGSVGTACLVLVTKNGDANYLAGDTIQVSLTSLKASQAAVNLSNASSMTSRETLVLSAVGGSGSGAFNYLVTNVGTAGCSLTGRNLVATSSGTCQIAASRAESQNYFVSATVSMTITVSKTAQTIRFTTDVPATPLAGGTYSPTVTASSGLTPAITATGSCAISSGVVTFNASGDCFIEASQAGDSVWLAASSVSQTIAVGRRNQTLTFQPATTQIVSKTFGDQAFQIQAVSTDQAATVSYTLSPQTTNNACDVIGNGLVIVQNVGDCVILAYSLQTAELAAASTISKRIEIKPDFASAPFVTSVAMSNLAINVGFIPPSYFGGSSISAFSLVAESQGQSPATSVSSTACLPTVSGNVSCRISGLQNGVTYRVKVAGINGAGVGEYSALSPSITVATNPAAVQNLRVVQGAATLAISWDDPESLGGGTFSAYRVYVKKSSTSSYNTEHYFNVANAATRNITISAETPPDGMGYLGGPTLSNGVAYDIKVVTVTTANAEELTGNTAVMNQIPRTVPDPPRLANALVVGNKLVLTWTAPISDGGAAVTTYSASVGNSPCTFANPTDTFCEIALPTAPGNYVFAIAAQNVAGSSTEIQGVFTVVSYNSSTPQTSGGSVVTDPVKPSESAPIISSVSFSVDGKQIFIRGKFLKGISKVVIGGIETRIVSQTSEMIIVTAPKLAAGSHAVLLHLTDRTVLRYEKELVVKGTKPAPVVKKTAKITGFKPGSSVLSTAMKNSLIKIFKANKGSKTLQCVGHTQGPSILKSDARLAMKRATAVCNFAKKQGIKVVSSSYQNNKKVGSQFRRVDLIFTR